MNNTVSWFAKRNVFIIGTIGLISYLISKYSVDIGICNNYASRCSDISYLFVIFSLIFVAVFIFSVITLKLKESTFEIWRNFSIWAIPFSLMLITFFPTRTHGLDFVPVTKGTVIFVLTILYSIVSLCLIISKSIQKE